MAGIISGKGILCSKSNSLVFRYKCFCTLRRLYLFNKTGKSNLCRQVRSFCAKRIAVGNPSFRTHLFRKQEQKPIIVRECFHPGASGKIPLKLGTPSKEIGAWSILKEMFCYLWPKDKPGIKGRVVVALGLLVGAKLLNVEVPFIFKYAVDFLNSHAGQTQSLSDPTDTVITMSIALMLGYGAARAGAALFNELRNAVFAKVAHSSIRHVARNVFLHLHDLDLSFHLSRQTGALSKVIDRGTSKMVKNITRQKD